MSKVRSHFASNKLAQTWCVWRKKAERTGDALVLSGAIQLLYGIPLPCSRTLIHSDFRRDDKIP